MVLFVQVSFLSFLFILLFSLPGRKLRDIVIDLSLCVDVCASLEKLGNLPGDGIHCLFCANQRKYLSLIMSLL